MSWMLKQKATKLGRSKVAKTVSANTSNAVTPDSQYAIWRDQVQADWRKLKAEPDHAERDRQKPALVQRYWDEYLQGWIASNVTHQNEVLAVVCVWAADVPECNVLVELVDAAVETGQKMPAWLNFKSDLITHISDTVRNRAEQVYKASQEGVNNGQLREFHLPDDFQAVLKRAQAGEWAINFVSLAKYHKLAGLEAESNQAWESALEHYREANKYPNVGVKTRLETAEAKVSSSQATGAEAEGDTSVPASPVADDPSQPVLPES